MLPESTVAALFILLAAALLVQAFFGYRQAMRMQRLVVGLIKKYGDDCCVGSGRARGFLLGKGCMVVLVARPSLEVVDAYAMKGFTIFCNLEQMSGLIGKSLDDFKTVDSRPRVTGFQRLFGKRGNVMSQALESAAFNMTDFIEVKASEKKSLEQSSVAAQEKQLEG